MQCTHPSLQSSFPSPPPQGSTCMESNRSVVIGGVDGKLRFLDGMMRSDKVERELEAFSVSV